MSAPLNLISLERVSKAHGTTVLLEDVSLGVAAGERIGVVGRNGSGKSTLLGVLTGTEDPDSGRVTRRGDLAVGVLDQSGTLPPGTTVRDVVLPASTFAAEHEWAADPAVRSVLSGLELDRLGLDAPVAPMSGGERRRVALAAQLIRPLDLLVLDEPTNHLDVEGVAWLAEYVKSRVGALVADSADLLDGHAVDGADLLGQQIDRGRLGQRHDELVDDATAAALEDVDRRHVAVHGADPAGHLAQGAGSVGQPHPHDERARRIGRDVLAHWCGTVTTPCLGDVTGA